MQKIFNGFACAAIVILLGAIFWPKMTVSAEIKPQVDSLSEITEALDGYSYDKLGYDDTNGVFKIYYQCNCQCLCTPKEIHIPVALEDISIH